MQSCTEWARQPTSHLFLFSFQKSSSHFCAPFFPKSWRDPPPVSHSEPGLHSSRINSCCYLNTYHRDTNQVSNKSFGGRCYKSLMALGPVLASSVLTTLQSSQWLRTRTWLSGRSFCVLSPAELRRLLTLVIHLFMQQIFIKQLLCA